MTKENNCKINGWKIAAVIFIVLFVLETLFLAWAFSVSRDEIEKERKCAYDVCQEYNTYSYDSDTNLCECWDESIISEKI